MLFACGILVYNGKGGLVLAISDAKKKANAKWDSANMATLACKVKREQADEFKAKCEQQGKTANTALKDFVLSVIGTETNPCSAPQEPAGAHGGSGYILTPEAAKTAQEAAQKAGETVPAFVERAVVTQAQRDKVAQGLSRAKEKAPEHSGT